MLSSAMLLLSSLLLSKDARVSASTASGVASYSNVVTYPGIPYAEPPVGNLRFRATVPLNTTRISEEAGGGVVNAIHHPEFCIHGPEKDGPGGAGAEDCLKINIYAPYGAKESDNLPVLFYVHGGGYVRGNPRNWPFDEFRDPKYSNFNARFQDQLQALGGQNAGGASVELHMGVFRTPVPIAEVHMSAYSDAVLALTLSARQPLLEFYSSYAGCGTGSTGGKWHVRETSGLYNPFHPVLDGVLFFCHPTLRFQLGQFARIPLIVGSTSNETLSLGKNISLALKEYFSALPKDIREFLALYPLTDYDSPSQVATGEPNVICGVSLMESYALTLYPNPSTLARSLELWTYRYNTPNPTLGSDAGECSLPAGRTRKLPAVGCDSPPAVPRANGTRTFSPQTPNELASASELIAYWLSFVRSGNPNTYKLNMSPTWAQYTPHNKTRMVLMQNFKNLTTVSGSYMEEQPTAEGDRFAFAISKVLRTED
ncbi:Alpha/Beta hydrolase protein [Lanmaoa asiatica]|nr:Alpha/Beta hydrolase protein [Lanmaoa asiatica]